MQLFSLCRHVNFKDGEYWCRNLFYQLDNLAKINCHKSIGSISSLNSLKK